VGGRRAHGAWLFGATAVRRLSLVAQHAGEGGLAGQVHAVVGQHGHDARRRHGREARLVGHAHELSTLGVAQGMAGLRAHRLRPAIARREAVVGLPALQGAHVDAGDLAGHVQPCSGGMRNADAL
jgi:hypothetical protein